MLYAILCYDQEDAVREWTEEQDAAVMESLGRVTKKLAAEKRLGPVARLMPTTKATTLRKGKTAVVMDGPFAETKEQLLGFYVVDCESLDHAIAIAKELAAASASEGAFEIRPLMMFQPGTAAS